MKFFQIRSLLSLSILGVVSCANTTLVMHKSALDINAEYSSDLTKPVSFNAGYESRAIVAVPPRDSQPLKTLVDQEVVPEGDVLSTVTAVKVERVIVRDAKASDSVAFDFIAAAATGKAADEATKNPAKTSEEGKATTVEDTAAKIVGNANSISPASTTAVAAPQ